MSFFKVKEILDSRTIRVSGWRANGKEGNLVQIKGYDVPDEKVDESFFKGILEKVLLHKEVELVGADKISQNKSKENVLHCRVYVQKTDIADFFIIDKKSQAIKSSK